MILTDVVAENGRIWVKSEWAPASEAWPAVSFSKRSVGDRLRREFRPGRDVIVYVGASNPATTEKPEHRQRLLSAVNIEPQQILETRDCIPAESWAEAQAHFRGRWLWCMPTKDIWTIAGYPLARQVMPSTYRRLGLMENRGNVVEVAPEERDALLQLAIDAVPFERPRKVEAFGKARTLLNLSDPIRDDIGRMVGLILERVAAGGAEQTSIRPVRTLRESDLHIVLGVKWREQDGRCYLCRGPLFPRTGNYLLQSSADRLDSQDNAYSEANTFLTHLGCNLGKNKASLGDFEDWLAVVRGEWSAPDDGGEE
jgi:hypothetical protein